MSKQQLLILCGGKGTSYSLFGTNQKSLHQLEPPLFLSSFNYIKLTDLDLEVILQQDIYQSRLKSIYPKEF